MNNEIMIFNNADFGEIRTLSVDGEPWFIGKDVAQLLGYRDTADALKKHVDEEDKLSRRFAYSGQNRTMYIINESGLYALILSSKLPAAKKFKRWVTSEVLPAIRKHGLYAVQELIDNPDLAIDAFTALKAEREKRKALEAETAVQAKQIEEMLPKVSYYDVVLNCTDLMTVNAIAKDYGKSAIWMNKWLNEHKVQYKQGDVWLLYQKYAKKGYTSSKTSTFTGTDGVQHCRTHTYWTQAGRLFIYNLLKEHGILPLIEQDGDTCDET